VQSEGATAADTLQALANAFVSLSEVVTAAATHDGVTGKFGSLAEALAADHTSTSAKSNGGNVNEVVNADAAHTQTILALVSLVEQLSADSQSKVLRYIINPRFYTYRAGIK
jgi:hypothetical protein